MPSDSADARLTPNEIRAGFGQRFKRGRLAEAENPSQLELSEGRGSSRNTQVSPTGACVPDRRLPTYLPTFIRSRQWSLGPHSSSRFRARVRTVSWKPCEAKT